MKLSFWLSLVRLLLYNLFSTIYHSHALRRNVEGDALRHASLERCWMHSHAERGNDKSWGLKLWMKLSFWLSLVRLLLYNLLSTIYRSHALRGNVEGDALRHASLERCWMHSHAERGNDKNSKFLECNSFSYCF